MSWLTNLEAGASVFWRHMGEAAWQATALALLVLLVVAFGRKWPSPLRHGLLLIALLKFAIPPVLPAPAGFFPWFDQGLGSLGNWAVEVAPEALAPQAMLALDAAPPARVGLVVKSAQPTIWLYLLAAYILGALVVVGRLIHDHLQLRRWLASARTVDDPVILAFYTQMCERLGLKRRPRLLLSGGVEVGEARVGPMAVGAWRPAILLPRQAVKELDADALRAVMTHEAAHHVRGDLWVQAVQNVLAVVWWFHPVFHVLIRCIRGVREDCCDDLLLGRGLVHDRSYCDAILDTADLVTTPLPAASLGFADRLHPLSRRLRRILDQDLKRAPRLSAFSVALLIAVAVGSLPGRMIGGPLAEEVLLMAKAERLADHELARIWPSFTFSQLGTAPEGVQLDHVHFQGDAIQMRGQADTTNALARLSEHLVGHPAIEVKFHGIRRKDFGQGYNFQLELVFDWSTQGLSTQGPSAAPGQMEEEAAAREFEAVTPNDSALVREAMTSIRKVLGTSKWRLDRFAPRLLQKRGPFADWPIEVEGAGSFEEIHQLLATLAKMPTLSFDSLSLAPASAGGLRMQAVLIVLLRETGSSDQEVTGGRRFSGRLEQIHQVLSTLGIPEDVPVHDPFRR